MSDRLARIVGPMVVLLLLILGWEVAVRITDTQTWMLPAPSDVMRSFRDDWRLLLEHTRVTLSEVLIGFGIALAAGLITGIAIAMPRRQCASGRGPTSDPGDFSANPCEESFPGSTVRPRAR